MPRRRAVTVLLRVLPIALMDAVFEDNVPLQSNRRQIARPPVGPLTPVMPAMQTLPSTDLNWIELAELLAAPQIALRPGA